ncbi:hypothetical protein Y032_0066g3726 [Ancylostoma ceylanicum]|uniref:Uncharacterized protein n=1 Tax=Ancylostoma ceylanicum TaxID=53326 RepID=A0A016U0I1_9BILA|nr:hypothetical protein Y032_0066g3726 [Ancylostoma ceylanicum]
MQALKIYSFEKKAAILCAINCALMGNYLLFVCTTFWPDERLQQKVSLITLLSKLDIEHASFIGLSIRVSYSNGSFTAQEICFIRLVFKNRDKS